MSVTLLDVVRAARVRAVPFSGESAGYVALAMCEEVEMSPRQVGLKDATLQADGQIRLLAGEACDRPLAEQSLRSTLAELLEVSSSPGPALFRAAQREIAGLKALASELEKALIPLNRSAARRALQRLHRETERAIESGRLAAPQTPSAASEVPTATSPVPAPAATAAVSPVVAMSPVLAAAPVAALPVVAAPLDEPESEPSQALETPYLGPTAPRPTVPAPPPQAIEDIAVLEASFEAADATRMEPTIARVRRRATPPPLPRTHDSVGDTPRMGSIDEYIVAVPSEPSSRKTRTPSPPPLPTFAREAQPGALTLSPPPLPVLPIDLTERMPPVMPRLAPNPDAPAAEGTNPIAPIPATALEPDAPIEESPALVVGVDIEDSEEQAEPVSDDELETRPLPRVIEPYRGLLARPSGVQELLAGFSVETLGTELELRRELKALAGVEFTPGPPTANASKR